ncbi:MAG TPA: hypothetical protein VG317_09395 [Pseudonocardiaceae bacterium]|nr:hypothetical protein [Pseudonocardiaceae bacterium]
MGSGTVSNTSWVKTPISIHASRWSTLPAQRIVLIVVHTVTSANRLLDVVPLFDSDLRVQLVFTCPGTSAISEGVEELFAELEVAAIPWSQAIHTKFDLAIAASNSGNLHELNAPIVVMSHGVGYSKYSPGNRKPETGNRKPEDRSTGCLRNGCCMMARSSPPRSFCRTTSSGTGWRPRFRRPSRTPSSPAIRVATGCTSARRCVTAIAGHSACWTTRN